MVHHWVPNIDVHATIHNATSGARSIHSNTASPEMKRGGGAFAIAPADADNGAYCDSTINCFACRSCGRYTSDAQSVHEALLLEGHT